MYIATLNESGCKIVVDIGELATYGDDPRDYTDNLEDIVFTSKQYAIASGEYTSEELADWPDHLPVWEYRPA